MKNFIISPSILSADFCRLGEEITRVIEAGADWIHIDVMDNHFVPNLTLGPQVVKAIRDYGITVPLDVHLMIDPVEKMIEPFAKAGADYITFHSEVAQHPHDIIKRIRDVGCKPGIAYNPPAAIDNLEDFIDDIDLVLVMSVNAGFGGQAFMPSVLPKVERAKQLIYQSTRDIRLEIDGGINLETITLAANAGADTFVMGSAIFGKHDYREILQKISQKLYIA